jgi:hypothetical protein
MIYDNLPITTLDISAVMQESTHMSLAAHPISQPSVDISPIWTATIEAEVRKLQFWPV